MATNDLADLNSRLATKIGDTTYDVWPTGEIDQIIKDSVFQLWPRYSRPLDPTTTTIALADDTYYYSLPSGVRAVSRVDLFDANSDPLGPITGRAWEVTGDLMADAGKLHIGDTFARTDYSVQLHGYGVYDTATNLINSELAPLVLARARAEAYRRVASDRVRFEEWLARNQTQNVSVNELIQFINEADAEANRLLAVTSRTWQKPVSGYVG